MVSTRFAAYRDRKTALALTGPIPGFRTLERTAGSDLVAVGNEWTTRLFDGPFLRSQPTAPDLPVVNLTFVQSADGNTGAADPSTLEGGETDKHLIYEGLSRIDADAVLAGAATAAGEDLVFSVWHPELVSLRGERGREQHQARPECEGGGERRGDGAIESESHEGGG